MYKASRAVTDVRYKVVVFTYNRPDGLRRILRSLLTARYPRGASVALSILVDAPKDKHDNLQGSGPASAARLETLEIVRGFKWPHGALTVHRRQVNVGLKRNILEAWYPSADGAEMCAFFEDDIEVSPYWFDWVVAAVDRYYFDDANGNSHRAKLLGISLYRPVHDELSRRGCVVSNNNEPFLLQQPCSWGAVYFPRAWRAFRDWYDEFDAGGADPRVVTAKGGEPDSNTWPRQSSWKKYLIKRMHEEGLAMVYPNLPQRAVFATNHLMKGEHPLPNRKLFELPLLDERGAAALWPAAAAGAAVDERRLIDPRSLPALDKLRRFDVMFDEDTADGGLQQYLAPKANAAADPGENKHHAQQHHHNHQRHHHHDKNGAE